MAKISFFWLGLFVQLSFFIHVSKQFQDPVYESFVDDEDRHGLNEKEIENILSQYDRDGDGELSAEEMEQYFHDAMASLQPEDGEGKPQQKQAKASAKKRPVKYKAQKQTQPSGGNGSQWSVKQVAGLLGVVCVIALCVAVVQRRNGSNEGVNMHVEDVRAARLRRLAAQHPNTRIENSTVTPETQASSLNRETVVSDNRQTIRRRLNDKSEESKSNTDATESINRLKNSKLLNTNMDRTDKDYQPQLITTERSVAPLNTASSVTATSSESCPITPSTGVSTVTSDQTVLAEIIMPDKVDVQVEELSPSFKTTVPKEQKLQDLPYEEVVEKVLSQVLECSFENQETKKDEALPLVKVGKDHGQVILQIEATELPVNSNELTKKLEKLLARRIYKELDPMKFSIQCFDRCSQLPGKNFKTIQDGEKIWKEVTSVILEPCVNTILKHLVHAAASPTSAEEDLWSEFVQSGQAEV